MDLINAATTTPVVTVTALELPLPTATQQASSLMDLDTPLVPASASTTSQVHFANTKEVKMKAPPVDQPMPDAGPLASTNQPEGGGEGDYSSDSNSESDISGSYVSDLEVEWIEHFISSRGNEYFCEIDEDYLQDRFNLTGLNTEVQYYQYALDLVNDVFDLDCDDEMRETIEKSARHLYGLVHARYIVTTRGLAKMLEKYKKTDFGKCPRVACHGHPLLPMGQADNPNIKAVKLYCSKCEDMYNPKSSRHAAIDGAYFGTSFHNILLQVYPALIPVKSRERYEPRIFGFKVHATAALARWQEERRTEMGRRVREWGGETGFAGEEESEVEEEGVVNGQ